MACAREQMPSRWALFVVAATAVALLAPAPAAGQPAMSDCYGGDPAKQIENCTRIINHPNSDRDDRATAYVYRARLYEGAGEWDKAIDDYTKSIGLDPSDPDVFFTRGRAFANKGAFANAIADYSAAIKADAAEFEYRLARGIACHIAGESEGAIVDFSAALGIEPNSAAAHFRRGEAYVARGERDRAIADFDAAIAIEPTSAVAFHARGDAYRSAGAYDRAVADYSEAVRLDAKFEAAYLHRAEALIAKHDFDGALADLDRVVDLDPNSANTRNIRGFVHGSKGEFQTAIADHTAAIIVEPLNAYRYSVRAWTYFKAGKTELALADAELAVRFAPYAASVYATRGLILEALRKNERAIADLQKALAVAPSIEEAREALIRLGATAPDPTPPRRAAAPSAVPSAFDEMAWLNGKLDRDSVSKAVFVRDDSAEVRSGPANAFPLIATARGNDRLSATARLEYKSKSGCGIDGASADAAWFKVRLADGHEGYVKSSEVVNDEQRQLLSQRMVLVRTAVDYYQKNNGPLQDFAGIYDGLKDCKGESDDSKLNDAMMREMIFAGLMVKQLIWFEGDTMVSVRFLNPDKPLRGRLTFWRDFKLAEGGAIKLYQIRYENGNSERIGFYRDMLIIDPKITGNSINYHYAKRCSQETVMIERAKRIYDVELAAKGD